jgi:hypothetical protein
MSNHHSISSLTSAHTVSEGRLPASQSPASQATTDLDIGFDRRPKFCRQVEISVYRYSQMQMRKRTVKGRSGFRPLMPLETSAASLGLRSYEIYKGEAGSAGTLPKLAYRQLQQQK